MRSKKLWPPGFRYRKCSVSKKQIQKHIANVPKCQCQGACELGTCLNNDGSIECNDTICNAPKNCKNRMITNNNIKKYVYIKQTDTMGVGAFAKRQITQGFIVMEYAGELITKQAKESILNDKTVKSFYIAKGAKGRFINAAHTGNESRFVNHGCEPNLELVKWEVGGKELRVLKALRNIEIDEQLFFDYGFEMRQILTACLCGAPTCRKYINKSNNNNVVPSTLTCGTCLKQFANKFNLGRHVQLVHEQKKPHVCNICHRRFGTKYTLQSHLVVHTKEKPYSCPNCLKRFTHSKSLWTHQKYTCKQNRSCVN